MAAPQTATEDYQHKNHESSDFYPDADIVQNQRTDRIQSFHVKWTHADVIRLAREIYEETVPEVHLSLFVYWICESTDNYELAKVHIRELGLDQVRISGMLSRLLKVN